MATKQFIEDIAVKLGPEDLAKLAAHVVLREQLGFAKEMARDLGNDSETRANSLLAQVDADELISQTQDGMYQQLVEEFFDDVSKFMIEYAPSYVKEVG
jgi:predicted transcriptional regulator